MKIKGRWFNLLLVEMVVIKVQSALGTCVLLVLEQHTYSCPTSCTEDLETKMSVRVHPFPSFPTL